MLEQHRQEKLYKIVMALKNVHGIIDVASDDYDSVSVNVFITLWNTGKFFVYLTDSSRLLPSLRTIPISLRSIKAGIRRTCKKVGVNFNFLDWPAKKYSYASIYGRRERFDEGYDKSIIKIEVMI